MSHFTIEIAPSAEKNTLVYGTLRISVLSDRIIRVEKDAKGEFCNLPTQTVFCRNFANPKFNVSISGNEVVIVTRQRKFFVDKLKTTVTVEISGKRVKATSIDNLGGTVRTLDGSFGIVNTWKMGDMHTNSLFVPNFHKGIFSKNGVAEIDDSKSFLLNADGSVSQRRIGIIDKYVLAFGDDYLGGLKEYYGLTGFTPLLPKYALGNWWSRYHAYTDKEYLSLMDEFEKKDIPISVATIDMDWHIVKNVPKDVKAKSLQGAGWTGYTVEKELFPDFKSFLKKLKCKGLAVTLNLHPRDGVRYFENQYEDMAKACGIDPSTRQTVEFDLTNKKFLNAYFDILHHPYENDGVDFWWIDWQQGTKSAMKGLDPLWLLNHYHFLDNRRDGKNGLILSRYAGLGSHRYPLGFSGDTFVCWKSLQLQPWFTAMASNVGYTWWSHDIGGHMMSRGNNELYLRWLQYGVFSPINRLHSTNYGISKEPWLYPNVESIAEDYMRLRHKLLPYLYTANVLTAKEGIPLITPMYYYCKDKNAYLKKYREQYFFGSEMLVAPIVHKAKADGLSQEKVWLPKGEWTDFFTSEKYIGGKEYFIRRDLKNYPVFVKQGAIIPLLQDGKHNNDSFENLEVRVYFGNNKYTMYDENGRIDFEISSNVDKAMLTIKPQGKMATKHLIIVFADVKGAQISCDGVAISDNNKAFIDCKECTLTLTNIAK